MRDLSDKQLKALEFIRNFIGERGHSPTHREICKALGIASVNGVKHHLDALEKKGCIKRNVKMARGIRLTAPYKAIDGLPLVVNFSGDLPLTALENVEGYYSFGAIFGDSGNLFLLRMKGDSMTGAGINDGDFVVVKQQPKVEDGEIGVAVTNGEADIKTIYYKGNNIRLNPANPKHSAFQYDPEKKDVRIIGKVVGVARKISVGK